MKPSNQNDGQKKISAKQQTCFFLTLAALPMQQK
jgi:hypothetical protein